jgi:hypothetical protein
MIGMPEVAMTIEGSAANAVLGEGLEAGGGIAGQTILVEEIGDRNSDSFPCSLRLSLVPTWNRCCRIGIRIFRCVLGFADTKVEVVAIFYAQCPFLRPFYNFMLMATPLGIPRKGFGGGYDVIH